MDNEICEARVGSSRHAAWVLHVIRFDLDALPANPRNRRAIIIGGSIATHLELLEALDKCGAGTVDIGVIYAENADMARDQRIRIFRSAIRPLPLSVRIPLSSEKSAARSMAAIASAVDAAMTRVRTAAAKSSTARTKSPAAAGSSNASTRSCDVRASRIETLIGGARTRDGSLGLRMESSIGSRL
jgi:hypothetical protein